jgi:hypothetical protein
MTTAVFPKPVAPEWREFSHPRGGYAVLMPGEPEEVVREQDTALGKITMTISDVAIEGERRLFLVGFADLPPGPGYADEAVAHKVLDGVLAGTTRGLGGEIREKSRLKPDGYRGQQCSFGLQGQRAEGTIRVFLAGNRLYQLITQWPTDEPDSAADAEKFLKSFRLLDREDSPRPKP